MQHFFEAAAQRPLQVGPEGALEGFLMILDILWEVPAAPFGKENVVFFALVFCKDKGSKCTMLLSVFGGGRRQGRGLSKSSDPAKSGQRFHHALLPLCGGAANFKASPPAAGPLQLKANS